MQFGFVQWHPHPQPSQKQVCGVKLSLGFATLGPLLWLQQAASSIPLHLAHCRVLAAFYLAVAAILIGWVYV